MAFESSPRLTQCTRRACRASSGSASSLIAITAMSIPWLRAPSSTRKGKRPLPAISPHPRLSVPALIWAEITCLFHDAAFGGFDEFHQFANVLGVGKLRSHLGESL